MVFRLNAAVSKLVRRISILLSSSSSLSFLFPAFPHVSLPLFSGKQEFVRFRRVDVLEGQRWVSTRIPLSSDKFAGERAYVKSVAVGERK